MDRVVDAFAYYRHTHAVRLWWSAFAAEWRRIGWIYFADVKARRVKPWP